MNPEGPYRGKRALDLTLLAALAIPSVSTGIVCALAIKWADGGSVFFRQERIGKGGRPFQVWKFRTMTDAPDNPIFPDARRITGPGRLLRRLSLDELPQLINVARGEMSIVGPRPALRYQVKRYNERQRERLLARPGITGLAQIRGRNRIGWNERIEYDLEYIERQSLMLDLRILGETVKAVLRGSGVEGHPEDDPLARPDALHSSRSVPGKGRIDERSD